MRVTLLVTFNYITVSTNPKLRQENGSNQKRRKMYNGTDKDYVPSAQKPDLPQEVYDVLL